MAVRICVLELSCVSEKTDDKFLFGEAEKKRLRGIKNPTRRRESEAGLLALKKAVGDRAFSDVVRDECGRPHFEGDIGIDFNISHSGSLSVAAVCDGEEGRVGVDIELVKDERFEKLLRIADRYFSESERAIFYKSRDVLEFYRVWTKKEAYAKLIGVGLAKTLGIKKEPCESFKASCFTVEHSGEKYVLSLCTEKCGSKEIEFILEGGISVKPLKESEN